MSSPFTSILVVIHRAPPGGGESKAEVAKRALSALDEISKRHMGETVIVVSHGNCISAIISTILNSRTDDAKFHSNLHIPNTSLTVLKRKFKNGDQSLDANWTLAKLGDTAHQETWVKDDRSSWKNVLLTVGIVGAVVAGGLWLTNSRDKL